MEKIKLSDEAKALRNAYQREWKQKNPDKVRKNTANYWERKAAQYQQQETAEDRILKLYKQGYSLRDIAEKTGVSHTQVSRIIKKCNNVTTM